MGTNAEDAVARAEQLVYPVRSGSDSIILQLANGYSITKASGFRGQNVIVEIEVPAGKKIRFDNTVEEKLSAFSIPFKQQYRYGYKKGWEARWENDYDYQEWEPNIDYTMGADGELINPNVASSEPQPAVVEEAYSTDEAAERKRDSLDRVMAELERQKAELERADDE
jgi:hypothetical protein